MKIQDLLDKVKESNSITEKEINLLKNRLNRGEKIPMPEIWDGEITLTREQNEKGIAFLRSLIYAPTGKERSHSFGYREKNIVDNFTGFIFKGFYNNGTMYRDSWLPLYECCGDNTSFEYYYNGKINIVG